MEPLLVEWLTMCTKCRLESTIYFKLLAILVEESRTPSWRIKANYSTSVKNMVKTKAKLSYPLMWRYRLSASEFLT